MELSDEVFEKIRTQYKQNVENLKQSQLEIDRLKSELDKSQLETASTKENYREMIEELIKQFENRLKLNIENSHKTINELNKENERLRKENEELKNNKDKDEKATPVKGNFKISQPSFYNDSDFKALKKEEQERYLQFYAFYDAIDRVNEVKYLYVSIDLSGTLWMYNASSYKNAPIIQIELGKLLPNPYYFNQFSAKCEQKGECGDKLKKISKIFNFNTEISDEKKYSIIAVSPAYSLEYADKFGLSETGKIWIIEKK